MPRAARLIRPGSRPGARNCACAANGAILVDDNFATADPSIYALGDVIDRVQLTPVAIQEAMVLVDHLYGEGLASIDYSDIPTAVFCQPELGTVGLSEEQAGRNTQRLQCMSRILSLCCRHWAAALTALP